MYSFDLNDSHQNSTSRMKDAKLTPHDQNGAHQDSVLFGTTQYSLSSELVQQSTTMRNIFFYVFSTFQTPWRHIPGCRKISERCNVDPK